MNAGIGTVTTELIFATKRLNCPVCGSASIRPIAEVIHLAHNITYFVCRSCLAMFQNPTIAQDDIENFYASIYPVLYRRHNSASIIDAQKKRAEKFLEFISTHIEKPKEVLEIGCSAGLLGQAYLKRYPEAAYVGVELDEHLAALATEHFPVARSVKEHGERRYDLILMSHVLEHFFDPVAYLATLSRYLTPNGRVIIEIPNGNAGYGFEVAHPHVFTSSALAAMAKRARMSLITTYQHNSYKLNRTIRPRYLSAIFERDSGQRPSDHLGDIHMQHAAPTLVDELKLSVRVATSGGRKAALPALIRLAAGKVPRIRL